MKRKRRTWGNNYGRASAPAKRSKGRTVRITCPHCGRQPLAYLRLVVARYLECPYCHGTIEPFAKRNGANG